MRPHNNKRTILGILMVLCATIGYALVPSFSFLAFRKGVAQETLLFSKFIYAAVLMWAYILVKRLPYKLDKDKIPMMLIVGLAYISLATTLYLSFKYISGSLATIISFTFPAMIVAIEMISGMEKVRLKKILAVGVSLCGMILIIWSPDIKGNITGIAFAFGTAISYVVYTMGLSTKKMTTTNTLVVAGYVLLMSAVFNFFRCLISGKPLFVSTLDQLWLMLVLAVFCAFMAILFFCMGVKYIGPGNTAIINTFEPALACLFGYLIIGDQLTKNMLIGSALIVTAVLIANWPKSSQPS